MTEPGEPAGKAARAICERTESVELGCACMWTASHEVPRNAVIAIAPIASRVRAAFCACGGLNAVTPFEIDSTPVSAADPEANALRRMKTLSVPVPAASGCGTVAWGHVPTV